jgi:HD-GYP domain-containing protein (c-di-GMP phosphodiesterase class II)
MDRDWDKGFEVRIGDLVFSVSTALDLVSPEVVGHHLRVARIARAIARELGYTRDQVRDLLMAAALHDCGAFSLSERLEIMQFEIRHPGDHAAAGFRLLKPFPPFERAAEIVRFHHLSWENRRGEQWRGLQVPPGSHLLHLADRISVLKADRPGVPGLGGRISRMGDSGSGPRFKPEFVEALKVAAGRSGFWGEVAADGDDDLRNDPALDEVILSEADFRGLARVFRQLVDFRSRFTATHTSGVTAVAGFLAPLAGVTGAAGRMVAVSASLHDLGKLAVPSETLEKEAALTRGEVATLRGHPLHGWRILGRIAGLEEINKWASYHHERLDGQGYPFGLPAEQLPLESRIVAVADVFTALTEERPYRRGMSGREAVGILGAMADGGALDHDVVALMARNRGEAAAIRRLAQDDASGRYIDFREHASEAVCADSAA